jgi:hypothetical protein
MVTGMFRDSPPRPPVVTATGQLIRQRQGIRLPIGWVGRQGPFDDTAEADRYMRCQIP